MCLLPAKVSVFVTLVSELFRRLRMVCFLCALFVLVIILYNQFVFVISYSVFFLRSSILQNMNKLGFGT